MFLLIKPTSYFQIYAICIYVAPHWFRELSAEGDIWIWNGQSKWGFTELLVVVVVVVVVVIIMVIFIIVVDVVDVVDNTIYFMQGIYTYIPETNHVSRE